MEKQAIEISIAEKKQEKGRWKNWNDHFTNFTTKKVLETTFLSGF